MKQQQKIEITINDYKTMCGVMDIASQRGAFRANELAGIGILHNRLIEYIRQNENSTVNGPNTPNIPNQPKVTKNEK
tara:strand:- start:737 stop:967 length:231 start_codon:yes stop_codon:yes gene_type:complete